MEQQTHADVEVLNPDRELELRGRKVTVRELTFVQALRLAPLVKQLVEDLAGSIRAGEEFQVAVVFEVLGRYPEATLGLLSASTGLPVAELELLSDIEGIDLVVAFMEANRDFFGSRIARAVRRAVLSGTPTSSPAS